jgi:hypothetical protein
MVKDSIRTYRTFIFIFLLTAAVLSILNLSLMKNIRNKNIIRKNGHQLVSDNAKKYGYSEILNLVLQNKDINILNISVSSENKNLVEIELSYKEADNLSSMYGYIEEIKKEKCFLGIENIKSIKIRKNTKILALLHFLKRIGSS